MLRTNNVSSAYERITAGTNDITTLVFLFDEIYSFNQIKKDRLTNGVLVREAKEKEGNDKNDKTNARMKHISTLCKWYECKGSQEWIYWIA